MNLPIQFHHPLIIDGCLIVAALYAAFMFTGVKANLIQIVFFAVLFLAARFLIANFLMIRFSYASAVIYIGLILWFLSKYSSIDGAWEWLFGFSFSIIALIGVSFLSTSGSLVFFGFR